MFEAFRQQAATQIAGWSLPEKVGQLFILAFPGKDAEAARPLITRYNLGGCYLSQDNADTFAEARELTRAMDGMRRADFPPLLLGVDQEGAWSVLSPDSTTGPGNLALGSAADPQLTAAMYGVYGNEMRSAGFNCVLGPCADINLKPNSPIIDTRSFGEIPVRVSAHVAAAVHGAHDGGIVACAKHFPGHGDTTGDTHRDIPSVDKSLEQLLEQDLAPFQAAIQSRVELIMTSHIRYPQIDPEHPATLSAPILQGILRERLGFKGIVISDSMNMGAIRRNYDAVDATLRAFRAGIDLIMLSEEHYDHQADYLERQLAMVEAVADAVRDGRFPEDELNAKLERVVAFKLARLEHMALYRDFDPAQSQQVERQAAEAAIKLLTDPGHCLPLRRDDAVVLIQTTPEADYDNLVNPRGIGPNQATPAFKYFAQALLEQHHNVTVLDHDLARTFVANAATQPGQVILAVTENYPLPGEDFKQDASRELVAALAERFGSRLVVISLRSNYLPVPEGVGHLCAYSSRPCSAEAAARACVGTPGI
ncbi:beta-N-acetylhexosaminidase [Andreprevotia lacus DSM 23236]|jgi:beta-N-acetylhexosaminidase|uniref:Beta-N-acetylhexosaminidase n=1 Tax=Andreprevotia lacus DSM 23236 TaxID=1121001 RepID=A0A1W1WXD8_9NEIS|nr:glycoside hydrolase family 3 N-terminal domain-containing protein [Andreprevotia lacus]SMC16267.1 beta-N-acetylhexosaminidase [Andreprevotia lacus DSM 23236]